MTIGTRPPRYEVSILGKPESFETPSYEEVASVIRSITHDTPPLKDGTIVMIDRMTGQKYMLVMNEGSGRWMER